MAEIIRSKGMAAFGGALVSVSGVKISPDLSVAKIYVSVFPSEKAQSVMEQLQENGRALRGELGNKVARQLRIVPEIVFYLDSSLDYVEHIEQLLKNEARAVHSVQIPFRKEVTQCDKHNFCDKRHRHVRGYGGTDNNTFCL